MATTTENVGLTLAEGTEKYSLDVVNNNLALIDSALGTLQTAVGANLGDKIGNYDDTEAGTVFGDLNIIKDQTEQNGTDIAEVKTVADGNSDKLTALQTTASNTKTVVDVINTNTETIKQNTETLKTTASNTKAVVDVINTNVSGNGTKLDTIADKADVISGQVQTVGNNVNTVKTDVAGVKTDIASVQTSVNTANTNISSVKSTVESTSGKVDTVNTNAASAKTAAEQNGTKIDTLQAQTEVKPFAWTKKATIGSGAWQTAVEITGRGTIAKALSLADAAYQMRITIDDEVVLYCNGLKGKWAGTIEDFASNSNSVYTPVMFYDGIVDIVMLNSSDCVWYIGCPGADVISAAVCFVSGGLRFYNKFKLEFMNFTTGAATVTGTITKDSTVTTL